MVERANALRALLAAEQQRGPDFLRLANALSALYPRDSEEKRLLDAMLLAVPRLRVSVKPEPVTEYVISPHAALEMRRRGLSVDLVERVLSRPEQRLDVRPGRVVLQSRVTLGEPARAYLVRVFVDVDRHPAEIVTAYRTSKVARYWQEET